jgi:hypothetical protein
MTIQPSSEVRLCNVPFTISQKDVMDFDNASDQANYFVSTGIANGNFDSEEFSYVRHNNSIKVPVEIDFIRNANYVMYRNDMFGMKWFYAFVTDMRYVNANTTEVFISTDVFQTWQFDVDYKHSFIERCHVERWNSDGTPIINTVDEGLNYGTEYDVQEITHYHPQNGVLFLVIATTEKMHLAGGIDPGHNLSISPLTFYVHPFKIGSGDPPTCNLGTLAPLESVLKSLYSDVKAVNKIVSLTITDHIGVDVNSSGTSVTFPESDFQLQPIGESDDNTIYVYDLASYTTQSHSFGNKYDGYKNVTESKLLMHPYTQVILSDSKGNQISYRNEYINSDNLNLLIKGSIGTGNKVAYCLDNYNHSSGLSNQHVIDLENAIINNDPSDVPIITELISAYIQGNKNSLATQKAQIQFNMKMDTLGGVAGLLTGGANAGASVGDNTRGLNVLNNVSGLVSGGLGTLQTRGNHQLALQGMMSKQQDISNVPPSISGMGANIFFDVGNNYNGVYLIKKQIKQEYINQLQDYFKMFGYKVQKIQTPNFKSRKSFNYIKTTDITLTGNCPQNDLEAFKNIFNNGVTVWHTSDVGNYNLDNSEV